MTLRAGKLPPAMLAELLLKLHHRDPRVLLGPSVGRDAAIIDVGAGQAVVATTDPVTFTADHIGWYAVNVNANDIACMGARPAWFLATALLPVSAPDDMARAVFEDIATACDRLDIELIGGHTEVTLGIERPIVSGTMLGIAPRDEIVMGESVRPGDRVLLTKGIAIEGTALLAKDSASVLGERGVRTDTIARASSMLFDPGISIVADARAISSVTRPRLMHDVTEGGIATALYETAVAAQARLRIDGGSIRVFPETREICDALALDPRGLLASGALLAIVDRDDCTAVAAALEQMEIECRHIGSVESGAAGVILDGEDSSAPLTAFDRDELARFYDASGVESPTSNRLEGS